MYAHIYMRRRMNVRLIPVLGTAGWTRSSPPYPDTVEGVIVEALGWCSIGIRKNTYVLIELAKVIMVTHLFEGD